MNWLTRMRVDSRAAHQEKIYDSYAWHKKIWECFPDCPTRQRDFLTRIDHIEDAFCVWLLSNKRPVCPEWCLQENFSSKKISPSFLSHQYYAFDLKVNPIKAVVQYDEKGNPLRDANGKRKRGKRIPLADQDELRTWLARKGSIRCQDQSGHNISGGFRIVDDMPLEIRPMQEYHFRKKGQSAYHGAVQFRGTLEVTDKEYFIKTYQQGIGSAKGFGFGLLLLAPVNL